MPIQSARAKNIELYIQNHSDRYVANYRLEIEGKFKVFESYSLPIDLLTYNIDNGRIFVEKQEWEKEHGYALNPESPSDAKEIRDMLVRMDSSKTSDLRQDLVEKGQAEPGVITHNGVVINGNRRMAILQTLYEETSLQKWQFLEVIVLPASVSQKDLWRIEAGLQLSAEKRAEYHAVNDLLKIKQGLTMGLSAQDMSAVIYGKGIKSINESLERLSLIDFFLEFIGQPGNYSIIKKYGLNEYFINLRNNLKKSEKKDITGSQKQDQIIQTFALIYAHIQLLQSGDTYTKSFSHHAIRRLGDIFEDPNARETYLQSLPSHNLQTKDISPQTLIDDFSVAEEIVNSQKDKKKPSLLINKALTNLNSVDLDTLKNDKSVIPLLNSLIARAEEIKGKIVIK